MKSKKIMAIILATAMLAGMSINSFAAENVQESNSHIKIINQSENISEQAIKELISDVNVNLVYDDGAVSPVESVVTIEDVSKYARSANSGNAYKVAVRSNVESDADNKNDEGVSASIYLELMWTDVSGPNNTMDSIQGNIDVFEGELKSSSLMYRDFLSLNSQKTFNLGSVTSFYKDLGGYRATTPHAFYSARFKDARWELNVSVTPSVFD